MISNGCQVFLDGRVTLHAGDCLAVVKTLADASIDACVTDPPYALVSIVKRFGKTSQGDDTQTSDRSRKGADGYARLAKGFMGKEWDNGATAFAVEFWAEIFRVLKPGAHVVAFGGTRTYHRMACAIEDAGFEIRDQIAWLYGSGFPKSHDVSKAIDKALGVERDKVKRVRFDGKPTGYEGASFNACDVSMQSGPPITESARQWEGWGTALKPAIEPICLARKPLSEKSVAANVLRWGTGAINVDATRVGDEQTVTLRNGNSGGNGAYGRDERKFSRINPPGRWPANIVHDGSAEVLAAFPDADGARAGVGPQYGDKSAVNAYGNWGPRQVMEPRNDSGSAARFFYSAKADADDRLGSKHPTVKPVDLMQWLCRLVCPPGGTILDPFAGTGTTGEAAWREGFNAVLIEREAEYQADIARRMGLCLSGPATRSAESAKARYADKPKDNGPLFSGTGLAGGAA
jgi:site-specific DNA-methyltransferase (adenine-specific)